MTPPKEPKSFKYPRLYFTPYPEKARRGFVSAVMLRIIYPDGRPSERTYAETVDHLFPSNNQPCCWQQKHKDHDFTIISMTPRQQLRALKKFCKDRNAECLFIGEIK